MFMLEENGKHPETIDLFGNRKRITEEINLDQGFVIIWMIVIINVMVVNWEKL